MIDLYAMKFDPVLKARESPNWIVENTLLEALKHMILENSSGSIQRTVLERWLRNKDAAYIFNMIRRLRPKDVLKHVYFSSVSAVGDDARRGYLRIDAYVNYFRTDGRGDRVDVVMPMNASRLAIETEETREHLTKSR